MRLPITETMAASMLNNPPRNDVLIPRNAVWVARGSQFPISTLDRIHTFIEKSGIEDPSRLNYYNPDERRYVSVRDMTEAELFNFGKRYAEYGERVLLETRWVLESMAVGTRLDWFSTSLMRESMKMLADIQI